VVIPHGMEDGLGRPSAPAAPLFPETVDG
jgi:hypothetical protein